MVKIAVWVPACNAWTYTPLVILSISLEKQLLHVRVSTLENKLFINGGWGSLTQRCLSGHPFG